MTRRAFTLLELLVVIGIIGVLAGMVFAGVTVARRSAMKTRTVSTLQQVSQALNSYRTLNGVYPQAYGPSTADVYAGQFRNGTGYRLASDSAIAWQTVAETMALQLNRGGESLPVPPRDAWGSVLRYRPAKHYPFLDSAVLAIDKDQDVPCRDSFQLWSIGPDKVDQYAADGSDDIPAWR